jgi:hypothetical protein
MIRRQDASPRLGLREFRIFDMLATVILNLLLNIRFSVSGLTDAKITHRYFFGRSTPLDQIPDA